MTQEQRDYEERIGGFVTTTAYCMGLSVAVAVAFADGSTLALALGGTLATVGFYRVIFRVPPHRREVVAHVFNFMRMATAMLALPKGGPAAVVFVECVLSSLMISTHRAHTAAAMAVAVAILFYVPCVWPAAAPAWFTFGAFTMLTWRQLYYLMRADQAAQRGHMTVLHAAENALEREAVDIAARAASLDVLNDELLGANARLRETLARETAATACLRDRRGDERALVDAMHHDIREPLRSIVSFNQLIARRLSKRALTPRARQYLGFVTDAGARMTTMLDDLLAYSTRSAETERAAVPLAAVVGDARANLADRIARTGATVAVEGPLPLVLGYETPLLQLFQNLLANAIKFARPGVPPRISIAAARLADGGYGVYVRDNGIGIAPERIGGIFGLFDRGGADESSEGSGVGLALCRRVARQHGGDLDVTSVAGEGSRFTFSLPAAAIAGGAAGTTAAPGDASPANASPADANAVLPPQPHPNA